MQTISIGRDASSNIVLNDKTVSRIHAQLKIFGDGRVVIQDLGSSNGTFVNGNKISEQLLNAGDIVKCGSSFVNWSLAISENQNNGFFLNQKSEIPSLKNQFSFSSRPIDINDLRHEKEKTYFIIAMVFSCLIWILAIGFLIFFSSIIIPFILIAIISILVIIIILWIISMSFKAHLYGSCVRVNINQYPEIHKISTEFSARLGLRQTPDLFISNKDGLVNAFSQKILSKEYVILSSSLVDLMLASKNIDALSMIIGHELGHHAAGHTNYWKNLFLRPAFVIPFLGAAYGRACQLTADRIGFVLSDNLIESQNALLALALGSEHLLQSSNIAEFSNQESDIPDLMGFVQKIFSWYPRTTKRVIEINSYGNKCKIV